MICETLLFTEPEAKALALRALRTLEHQSEYKAIRRHYIYLEDRMSMAVASPISSASRKASIIVSVESANLLGLTKC